MELRTFFFILLLISLNIFSGCDQGNKGDSPKSDLSDSITSKQVANQEGLADDVKIPDQPVSGQVMGKPFHPDRIELSDMGNTLIFYTGDRFLPEARISIRLIMPFNESPAGRSFNISGDNGKMNHPTIEINLNPKSGKTALERIRDKYRLKLSFSEAVEHRLDGRIFLKVPGKGTEIAGVFQTEAPESPDQPPAERHRPFVCGRIVFLKAEGKIVSAAYSGMGPDREVYHNGAGLKVMEGNAGAGGFVHSSSFNPRNTTVWCDDQGSLWFRHVRLVPGHYIFALLWDDHLVAHSWQRVDENSMLHWNPEVDLSESGSLLVEVPELKEHERIRLLPLGGLPGLQAKIDYEKLRRLPFFLNITPEISGNTGLFRFLAPGPYLIIYNNQRQEVEVSKGKRVKISLNAK
jgi:hypothetical protein